MRRPCIVPTCPSFTTTTRCAIHEQRHQRQRNAEPQRRELYGGDWPATSRAIRAQHPWCSVSGCRGTDLTVDHPTMSVLCRSHHNAMEHQRRRERSRL